MIKTKYTMDQLLLNISAAFAALITTIIGSFSGGGSSLMMFPLLLSFLPGTYLSLFLMSKISAAVMTITSSRIHFKKGKLDLKLLMIIIVSGLLGTGLGTYILTYKFDEILFKKLLVGLIFTTAFYLLFSREKGLKGGNEKPLTPLAITNVFLMSFVINTLNGVLGGTGLLMGIYLVIYLRMEFIRAIAYTMLTYAVLSTFQAAYLFSQVEIDGALAASVVVGALAGGYLGTNLQYLKGNLKVKRAAIVVMFAIGIKLLFDLVLG